MLTPDAHSLYNLLTGLQSSKLEAFLVPAGPTCIVVLSSLPHQEQQQQGASQGHDDAALMEHCMQLLRRGGCHVLWVECGGESQRVRAYGRMFLF